MAPGRARPGPHARPQGQELHAIRPSIRGDEIRALRKLRREDPTEAYVFVTERGGPISTIGFHHLIQRLGKAARMPSHCILTCCGMRAATNLPTTVTIPERCSTISATRISSTPSDTPSFHPTGFATFGEIRWAGPDPGSVHLKRAWYVRQMRPPVGGTLDSENCSCPLSQKPVQKRFLPRKGMIAFLWKAFLQKNFQVRKRISLSALAFGCSHACGEAFNSRHLVSVQKPFLGTRAWVGVH